jgi:hypothetical protein
VIRRARWAPAAAAFLGALLAGCSPTTYDSSATTAAVSITATTLPQGTVAELLPGMQAEVAALADKVAAGSGANEAATRIEQYWAAMAEQMATDHPQLVADFEFVVRLCREAADRKRPADADRAASNLAALATAIAD